MKILTILIYIFFLIVSSSCTAKKINDSTAILEHVSRNILKVTSEYAHQIEHCKKIILSNSIPTLDKSNFHFLGASRENIILALSFLSFHNNFLCGQEAHLALAYHLGTMRSLKQELGIEEESTKTIQSIIAYPSKQELLLEVEYLKLSKEIRSHFESIIDNKPFDLMKTLEANGLLRQ